MRTALAMFICDRSSFRAVGVLVAPYPSQRARAALLYAVCACITCTCHVTLVRYGLFRRMSVKAYDDTARIRVLTISLELACVLVALCARSVAHRRRF